MRAIDPFNESEIRRTLTYDAGETIGYYRSNKLQFPGSWFFPEELGGEINIEIDLSEFKNKSRWVQELCEDNPE